MQQSIPKQDNLSIYHAEPYPEYDAETIRAINISEAETIATNTIKTYYEDVIDLNKYELTEKIETTYEGGLSYKFTWKKYIKGVKTGRIIIYVTQNGEIVSFEYDARDQAEDKIPDYTKEEYLEACQIRLQEIYDEVGYQGYNDVKITSIEFFETTVMIASDFQSAYMRDIEKYCIECPVIYQFEYGDGKTNSGTAFLYYPYAE